MKHDLYDVLSHEVASFVRGMTSSFDLIQLYRDKDHIELDEKIADALKSIRNQVLGLDHLQSELERLWRRGDTCPCSLHDAILGIRSLFTLQLDKRQISLIWRSNQHMWIAVPISMVFLALSHLVRNTFEAMDQPVYIDIDIAAGAGHAICKVRDSGPSVAEAVRTNLFDRGTTTKADRSAEKRGIGLSDSREALLQSGAMIELVDPGPGGTIFAITFPQYLQENTDDK